MISSDCFKQSLVDKSSFLVYDNSKGIFPEFFPVRNAQSIFTRQNFILLGILLTALAIAATVYLVRQQQELRKHAEGLSSLTFVDAAGNQVTSTSTQTVKLKLQFDTSMLPTATLTPTGVPSSSPTPTSNATPTPTTPSTLGSRVFVTSTTHTGNLGGISGADAICQTRANAATIGGTWKAWISGGTVETSAATRLSHSTIPYKLLDGTQVAANWNDLTTIDSGSTTFQVLANPINMTENRAILSAGDAFSVWTNTTIAGDHFSSDPCVGWTSSTGSAGVSGNFSQINSAWTYAAVEVPVLFPISCSFLAHLYCIEQ